jgi:ERCC4-type nuclease
MTDPKPFVVLCDTREQTPAPLPPGCVYQRATMGEGDYTTPWLIDRARIERKNPEDFVASVSSGHDRFFREAERLKAYPHRWIIVEADLSYFWPEGPEFDVLGRRRRTRSHVHPNAVIGNICSLAARYGLPTLFARDPITAGRMIVGILRRLEEIT